jgi:CheY-specific phosphatase CheX
MLKQKVFDTACRVFEEAAFAFVDAPDSAEMETPNRRRLACLLGFEGPFSGVLAIAASDQTAHAFAVNMLGLDESEPEAAGRSADALGEILNMICGNLLPVIAGKNPEFDISTPMRLQSEEFDRIKTEAPPSRVTSVLTLVDGRKTEIILILNSDQDQLT